MLSRLQRFKHDDGFAGGDRKVSTTVTVAMMLTLSPKPATADMFEGLGSGSWDHTMGGRGWRPARVRVREREREGLALFSLIPLKKEEEEEEERERERWVKVHQHTGRTPHSATRSAQRCRVWEQLLFCSVKCPGVKARTHLPSERAPAHRLSAQTHSGEVNSWGCTERGLVLTLRVISPAVGKPAPLSCTTSGDHV